MYVCPKCETDVKDVRKLICYLRNVHALSDGQECTIVCSQNFCQQTFKCISVAKDKRLSVNQLKRHKIHKTIDFCIYFNDNTVNPLILACMPLATGSLPLAGLAVGGGK